MHLNDLFEAASGWLFALVHRFGRAIPPIRLRLILLDFHLEVGENDGIEGLSAMTGGHDARVQK